MFEFQQQLNLMQSDKKYFSNLSILPIDQKTGHKTLALLLSCPQMMTLFGGGYIIFKYNKKPLTRIIQWEVTTVNHNYE